MYTVEEKLKMEQPQEYKWLQQHRSKLTVFFLWLESRLDKLMGVLR
jgi:hypothetical protein